MSILFGRDGNISIIRVGTLAAVLGLLFILGAIASFFIDQESRRRPFDVPLIEGAQQWGEVEQSLVRPERRVFYRVDKDTAEVAAYYQARLDDHSNNGDRCVRIPSVGDLPGTENDDRAVGHQYTCLFDNAGFFATQHTMIKIWPGTASDDPELDSLGLTVIQYDQLWQD
jgi:hypothetical protein